MFIKVHTLNLFKNNTFDTANCCTAIPPDSFGSYDPLNTAPTAPFISDLSLTRVAILFHTRFTVQLEEKVQLSRIFTIFGRKFLNMKRCEGFQFFKGKVFLASMDRAVASLRNQKNNDFRNSLKIQFLATQKTHIR